MRLYNKWFYFIMVLFVIGAISPISVMGADTIRFGVLPVVDTLPLLVGQEEDLFFKEGIDLQIVSFTSALERDAGLLSGQLDGYFGDLLNTIQLIEAGQKIGVVTVCYHTTTQHRMFGIVTSPGAETKDLAGLKGRPVAISRATIIEHLLDRILAANQLPGDFVEKQEIKQIPIRLQMLLGGKIPAALLPEPLLTLAEIKGGRVLADDCDLNTTLTVLALDRKILDNDKTLGSRFLSAYNEAVKRVNQDPGKYVPLMIARTRFPEPVKDKYRIPVFPQVGPPSEAEVKAAQDWLKINGLVDNFVLYEEIVIPHPN